MRIKGLCNSHGVLAHSEFSEEQSLLSCAYFDQILRTKQSEAVWTLFLPMEISRSFLTLDCARYSRDVLK